MADNNGGAAVHGGDNGGGGYSPAEEEMNALLTWLLNDDEGANELSNFLEASSENTFPAKVKIIDDPYWLPVVFQTAASYVTINGNDELCGSSFSDSDTSYMAGISCGCGGGAWDEAARGFVVSDGGTWKEGRGWMEDVNGEWCDDDMLAMFLGEGVGESRGE